MTWKKSSLLVLVLCGLMGWWYVASGAVAEAPGDRRPGGADRPTGHMTCWQAAVLGVVEGLTEYLPVSSTGHLLVAQRVMGIGVEEQAGPAERERLKAAADAYAICIQAGAIVAVLGLYFGRVRQMTRGLLGRDAAGARLAGNLLAGFVPAAVVGLLVNDWLKARLFGPWPVVAAWAVGGAAILVVACARRQGCHDGRAGRSLDQLTWTMALVVGLAQCIAMWPGVSRSLVTIVAGVLVGLSLSAAVEFSFLLGLVTLGAATCYDGLKHGRLMAEMYSPAALGVGFVLAFVSAVVAVKWMVAYLRSHGLGLFGYYRLAVAAVVAACLWWGLI